jgi:hypothetical protein
MFKWFSKDPSKKLVKAYEAKLTQAMHAQRNGDIRTYSMLSKEADDIYQEIQRVTANESA